MPSVSSWAAEEREPRCARALQCGLVRARASSPRLPAGRNVLGGLPLRVGWRPARVLSSPGPRTEAPERARSGAHAPRWARKAGWDAPGDLPLTRLPGPLPWGRGPRAQAVGRGGAAAWARPPPAA